MTNGPTISRKNGVALIAVLWLIAILSMACFATLRVISFDMELASAKIHGSRARQVAERGIAIGANAAIKRSDPLLHYNDEETGEGFDVKITSEAARIGINALLLSEDKSLLRSLFIDWGMDLDSAQALVDALSDWVDSDDETALNGAEKKYYESQGRINQPFNRPFYNLDEMALVRGMDRIAALKPDWRNWFTIWSDGRVNLNDASAELIAAAAEVPADSADILPETIRGPDGIRDTDDDIPFETVEAALQLIGVSRPDIASRFSVDKNGPERIESTGFAEGATRRITVILRNRTGQPAMLDRIEEIIPTP